VGGVAELEGEKHGAFLPEQRQQLVERHAAPVGALAAGAVPGQPDAEDACCGWQLDAL